MKRFLPFVLIFFATVAGAQTIFTADPTYDYSGVDWLEGLDTVSVPGDYVIAEQINDVSESSTSVTLLASNGTSYTFTRTAVAFTGGHDGVTTWTGSCTSLSYPNGVVNLAIQGGIISGRMALTDTFVTGITSIGDDHYIIYEMGDLSSDCDAGLYSSDFSNDSVNPGGRIGNDCAAFVMYRLILAYTPQYAASIGNQAAVNTELKNVVDKINETYIASNVAIRVRLAFAYQTSESESGDFSQDFSDFSTQYYPAINSSKFDIVQSYLNYYRGDVAGILVSNYSNGKAGRSSQNNKRFLYKGTAASWNFGAAHEIGHIFGLEHNIQEFSGWSWPARLVLNRKHAYGYRTASKKCVMSYGDQTREHVYSCTDYTFSNGETAGNDKAQGRNYMWSHFGNVAEYDDFYDMPLTNLTFVSNMMSHLYAYNSLTTSNVIIDGATVKLEASEVIQFLPGTWIKSGSNFSASIKPCENTTGARIASRPPVEEESKTEKALVKDTKSDVLQVFPNPARGNFSVAQYFKKRTDVKFVLRDLNANIIMEATASNVDEFVRTIDTTSLAKGVYFVETTTGTKRQVEKVVVQ